MTKTKKFRIYYPKEGVEELASVVVLAVSLDDARARVKVALLAGLTP